MPFVACRQYLTPRHRCALPFGTPSEELRYGLPALAARYGAQEFDEAGFGVGE